MHIDTLRSRFARDGYALIDGFFAPDLMDELHGAILRHFGDDPAFVHDDEFLDQSQTDVIPWFPQSDGPSPFDRVDADPQLAALTEALLGEGWKSHYCMVMYSKPGSRGQAWHQDCAPDSSSIFNLNRLAYTRDITQASGGEPVVVPGSHKRGQLPAGEPHGVIDEQVVLRPAKGSLLLLHGHTWHRVLPVRGACRVSTNYRAAPAGTPDDITDVCVYRNMRYRFSTAAIVERRFSDSG